MRFAIIALILFCGSNLTFSLDYSYSGEISTRVQYRFDDDDFLLQGRGLGSFNAKKATGDFEAIDLQLQPDIILDDNGDFELSFYRYWVRYSSVNTETRIGLQHINFGPARIMRSLQWFDQIDPDDPLGYTKGVKAVLYRRYYQNNLLWIWAVLSDSNAKGIELIPSQKNNLELGSRYELSALMGNLGLVVHYRPSLQSKEYDKEFRIGLDGRWDYGIGLWFEKAHSCYKGIDDSIDNYTFLTIGADYSLWGTTFTAETFYMNDLSLSVVDFGSTPLDLKTALAATYSYSFLDTINGTAYFDYNHSDFAFNLSWERMYDNLTINLALFSTPVRENIGNTDGHGKGILLTLKLNL